MRGKVYSAGCLCVWLSMSAVVSADIASGEFTYQGQLIQGGVPANASCDMEFTLWNDPASVLVGDQVGSALLFQGVDAIGVSNGLFSVVLDFGPESFNGQDRWLEVAVLCPSGPGALTTLTPRELITATPYSLQTRGLFVDQVGSVGMGTTAPRANLHVSGPGSFRGNHVAFFDSTGARSADGIAIQLANRSTNRDNNFLTFYNGSAVVTGRIEGFDLENGDWISPPPIPRIGFTVDPGISYNPNWLNVGTLPTATLDSGALPTLNFSPGSLPTATLNRGSLPTLTFSGGSLPSASFTRGSLPSASLNRGTLPSLSFSRTTVLGVSVITGFSWSAGSTPSLSFNDGSLPSLTFTRGSLPTASLNRGSLPTLSFRGGSLPTASLTGGRKPSLSFSGGSLPSIRKSPLIFGEPSLTFDLPTADELEALFCWADETGIHDFLGLDPVSIATVALRQAVAKVCKDEGVTYGSKGADYAEWLPKLNPEDQFQIGQIVGVHGGKVSLKTEGAEQIMAISRAPVVVGNVPPEDEKHNFVTVGFMGQLPVVVRGKVNTGDYIVPSGRQDGTARAVTPEDIQIEHIGLTLGRAWSESESEVFALVTVVIGLQGGEAKTILSRQRDRIDLQDRRQDSLTAENARLRGEVGAMDAKLVSLMEMVENMEAYVQTQVGCQDTLVHAGGTR